MGDMVDTVASDLLLPKLTPMLKPKLMLTTDMVDTAVDTDTEVMVDTVEVMEATDMVDIVANVLPLLKLTLMLKPKLTVTVMAVDTDTEVMVDTVEVMEVTDMVDTVERGPLMPKLIPKLTVTVMAVDTDMVDTVEVMEVTVMAVVMVMAVEVTTDRFYSDLFLCKVFFLLRFYFFVKFVHLSKSSKRIKSLDAHQSQINFMMLKKLK